MLANQQLVQSISSQIPIFQSVEQKETFLFVLGALLTRLISLKKAAEIMEMELDAFLNVLDLLGIEFSYLSDEDIELGKSLVMKIVFNSSSLIVLSRRLRAIDSRIKTIRANAQAGQRSW